MARRIQNGQVALLRFELTQGNARRIKVALQDICSRYRKGFILSSEQVNDIEALVNGIVLADGQDLKVVRWCLNALAQFGRITSSRAYVDAALFKYENDPEIQAAGVAALCRMYRGNVHDIDVLSTIDPVVWKLAALQNTAPAKLDLGSLRINIESASTAVLRLALITVGLNKDIEHLFHPKHTNGAFVKHLGQHYDTIVQQYSVWSVIENRRLGFSDLGVALDNIDGAAPNVQAKMYQLVAERDPDLRRRLDMSMRGSLHGVDEAREGLAKGVLHHFYDGLEEVTIGWFRQERHRFIRELLAEHFGRYANACGPYEDIALQIIDEDPTLKERILLGAEGRPFYARIKASEPKDLLFGIDETSLHNTLRSGTRPQLKVLLLAAAPLNESRVRSDEEYREIRSRLESRSPVEIALQFEPAVRTTDIIKILLNSNPNVLHFSGHGFSNGLVFEDAVGNARSVGSDDLAEIISSRSELRCVVLNACLTSPLADRLAARLEFVVGCDGEIDDGAAVLFSRTFYHALSRGRSFPESFNLAARDVKINASPAEAAKYVMRQRGG